MPSVGHRKTGRPLGRPVGAKSTVLCGECLRSPSYCECQAPRFRRVADGKPCQRDGTPLPVAPAAPSSPTAPPPDPRPTSPGTGPNPAAGPFAARALSDAELDQALPGAPPPGVYQAPAEPPPPPASAAATVPVVTTAPAPVPPVAHPPAPTNGTGHGGLSPAALDAVGRNLSLAPAEKAPEKSPDEQRADAAVAVTLSADELAQLRAISTAVTQGIFFLNNWAAGAFYYKRSVLDLPPPQPDHIRQGADLIHPTVKRLLGTHTTLGSIAAFGAVLTQHNVALAQGVRDQVRKEKAAGAAPDATAPLKRELDRTPAPPSSPPREPPPAPPGEAFHQVKVIAPPPEPEAPGT